MPSYVDKATAFSNPTAATLTASFGSNTVAGNLLVSLFGTGYTGGSALSTDSADTWTEVGGGDQTVNGSKAGIWYVLSCVGGKTGYSFSRPSNGNCSLGLAEFSGISGHDADSTPNIVTSTATASTGNVTTTNANDLLVALFLTNQTYSPADSDFDSTTLSSGWTWIGSSTPSTGTSANNHNTCVGMAYRVVSSTGTYSASVNTSGGTAVSATMGVALAFTASGAASTVYPFPTTIRLMEWEF